MKHSIFSFVSGLLFALGLGLSGMTQPQKIIAFLDVGGPWSPALLFVMAAAVLVFGVTYRLTRNWRAPIFASEWQLPEKGPITKSLVAGSLLFGIGWGLAGYCPGPAIVSLASLQTTTLVFVASMITGMKFFKFFEARPSSI